MPCYQALTESRSELSRCVLALARSSDGRLAGFSSSLILPVEGVGEVSHMGLVVVDPGARRHGLTHRLVGRALNAYLLRRLYRPTWLPRWCCGT